MDTITATACQDFPADSPPPPISKYAGKRRQREEPPNITKPPSPLKRARLKITPEFKPIHAFKRVDAERVQTLAICWLTHAKTAVKNLKKERKAKKDAVALRIQDNVYSSVEILEVMQTLSKINGIYIEGTLQHAKMMPANSSCIALLLDKADYLYVDYLCTNPLFLTARKSHGIGTRFLDFAQRAARGKGKKFVVLNPLASARPFYKRYGFVDEGKFMRLEVAIKVQRTILPNKTFFLPDSKVFIVPKKYYFKLGTEVEKKYPNHNLAHLLPKIARTEESNDPIILAIAKGRSFVAATKLVVQYAGVLKRGEIVHLNTNIPVQKLFDAYLSKLSKDSTRRVTVPKP